MRDDDPAAPAPPAPRRRRGILAAAAVALLAAGVVAAALFQPWRLWTVRTASDPAPAIAGAPLASGELGSLAHGTTGTAVLARATDGTVVLHLRDLATSDGPDLRVWLSTAGPSAARSADDATYLDLGPLRANRGSLTYALPADADPGEYRSVVIWCRRFSVAFGAAGLAPPPS